MCWLVGWLVRSNRSFVRYDFSYCTSPTLMKLVADVQHLYEISVARQLQLVSSNHLLHYYTSVIRPVLEYSAPVWHYAPTNEQTYQIERIQKRVIHIHLQLFSWHAVYFHALFCKPRKSRHSQKQSLSKILSRYYRALLLSSLSSSSHKRLIRYFAS